MGIAFDAPLPPRAKVTRHAVRTLLGFEIPWEWVLVQFPRWCHSAYLN